MWVWGLLVAMRCRWVVSSVGVLLLFVMMGVAFRWFAGFGRFASSLSLGWIVFSLLFLVE